MNATLDHLDQHQIVLLQRLRDADHLNQSEAHDFKTLMEHEHDQLPDHWYHETYEDFVALDLMDPAASGEAMGPTPFGRLSARGRWLLQQLDAREPYAGDAA